MIDIGIVFQPLVRELIMRFFKHIDQISFRSFLHTQLFFKESISGKIKQLRSFFPDTAVFFQHIINKTLCTGLQFDLVCRQFQQAEHFIKCTADIIIDLPQIHCDILYTHDRGRNLRQFNDLTKVNSQQLCIGIFFLIDITFFVQEAVIQKIFKQILSGSLCIIDRGLADQPFLITLVKSQGGRDQITHGLCSGSHGLRLVMTVRIIARLTVFFCIIDPNDQSLLFHQNNLSINSLFTK